MTDKNNKFEQLDAWKEAHVYTLAVYQATKSFPKQEVYSLVDQLRRAAVSVASNLVEGNERKSKKEFLQFLYMAKASLAESQYQLILARDLKYLTSDIYQRLNEQSHQVAKLLNGLIRYLRLNTESSQ
jgi:four helix bundle protein